MFESSKNKNKVQRLNPNKQKNKKQKKVQIDSIDLHRVLIECWEAKISWWGADGIIRSHWS